MSTLQHHHAEATSRTLFGFWIYIMTDCILFATLFATYVILHNNTYGGPSSKDLFELPFALGETMLLLTSTCTCGLAMVEAHRNNLRRTVFWFIVTFVLGAGFVGMELSEFSKFVEEGNSWKRSGFLTGFFTLVGTHGLHVTLGLIATIFLMAQTIKQGLNGVVLKRLQCLAMFWHFLDVIWIFIFTIVYLMGVL